MESDRKVGSVQSRQAGGGGEEEIDSGACDKVLLLRGVSAVQVSIEWRIPRFIMVMRIFACFYGNDAS